MDLLVLKQANFEGMALGRVEINKNYLFSNNGFVYYHDSTQPEPVSSGIDIYYAGFNIPEGKRLISDFYNFPAQARATIEYTGKIDTAVIWDHITATVINRKVINPHVSYDAEKKALLEINPNNFTLNNIVKVGSLFPASTTIEVTNPFNVPSTLIVLHTVLQTAEVTITE